MSNFTTENLIPITGTVKAGQRLLKLSDGTFLPIGIAGGSTPQSSDSQSETPSASMDFYKCTSVTQAQEASSYVTITVEDQQMSSVAGNYYPGENTFQNQPIYWHTSGNYFIQRDYNNAYWLIVHKDHQNDIEYNDASVAVYGANRQDIQGFFAGYQSPGRAAATLVLIPATTASWSGRKALFNDTLGYYEFQSNSTEDLVYSNIVPKIARIYSKDALIKSQLFTGIPSNGLVFYASLNGDYPSCADTQDSLILKGTMNFTVKNGIPCAYSDNSRGIGVNKNKADFDILPQKTMSCWIYYTSLPSSEASIFFCTQSAGGFTFQLEAGGDGAFYRRSGNDYVKASFGTLQTNKWYHLLVTDNGSSLITYVNGIQTDQKAVSTYSKAADAYKTGITCPSTDTSGLYGTYNLIGYAAAFRMYNRVLETQEIQALSRQFTPTA